MFHKPQAVHPKIGAFQASDWTTDGIPQGCYQVFSRKVRWTVLKFRRVSLWNVASRWEQQISRRKGKSDQSFSEQR